MSDGVGLIALTNALIATSINLSLLSVDLLTSGHGITGMVAGKTNPPKVGRS